MGRTKKQKAAAALDEPGPDDYTFLAVFFPVGRNGAALTKDSDPEDQRAADRIGRWLNQAGLPIRKLFSRKSEEHVIVEVRKEVPQDVIDSKLGAYKWRDMLHSILPRNYNSESTILRARVRSHDAIDKMGGMVYFPIASMGPAESGSQSPFKQPFPKPKRVGYAEPSTFSAIRYIPLPPEFTLVDDGDTKPDVKPDIKPDIKPDVTADAGVDVKPGVSNPVPSNNETKPLIEPEIKPRPEATQRTKPEPEEKPVKSEEEQREIMMRTRPMIDVHRDWSSIRPVVDMNPPVKQEEKKPKIEQPVKSEEEQRAIMMRTRLMIDVHRDWSSIRPVVDMNPPVKQEEKKPKIEQLDQPTPTESTGSSEPPSAQTENEPSPRVKDEPAQAAGLKRTAADMGEREQGVKRERLGA